MGGAPTRHRGRSRYPTRSRNAGAPAGTPTSSFNPLTDWTTPPVHGVWASDPLWTPPADGGAVSDWRNGGSVGTPNFTQATGSKQPTFRASTAAFNSKPTVQGDGTDDFLACNFADLTQPIWIVLIASYGNNTATGKYLCDAFSVQAGVIYNNSSTRYYIYSGVVVDTGDTLDANTHVHVVKFSGASSSYHLDGASIWTGNAGVLGMDGTTLFARAGGGGGNLPGHIAYYALFTSDPTAQTEWTAFKAWCLSFYGVTVA